MLSSMTLLWAALKREESVGRGSEAAQGSRHTASSVYFRSTKVCWSCTLPLCWAYMAQGRVQNLLCVNPVR